MMFQFFPPSSFLAPADGLKKFAFVCPQAWTIFSVKISKLPNVKMMH